MKLAARGSRGISLAEALVAITVLALASTAAMMLYSGARRSFKVGSNLTEQQQNVRIAFDELTEDLRHVGFNVHPVTRNRPDEQIELALATAIVMRADIDATDPAASIEPEESLAGLLHTVSTGNDEVFAYVLAKSPASDDPPSTDSFAFDADMIGPIRDGEVESIVVEGVALTHDDPPYTLYRVSWDAAGDEVREPLVDQISALRFVYYDERGQALAPVPGEDDVPGVNPRSRASIRRIHVRVEGMTRDPDLRWRGSSAAATADGGHRRFDLAADVTPRNLGLFGVADLEATISPPSRPQAPTLYEGHCGGLWVEWAPNPPQDAVARYDLHWGTDPQNVFTGPLYSVPTEAYLGGLVTDTRYYVTVTAIDDSGSASQASIPVARVVENQNTPEAVNDATASEVLEGHILVSWTPVTDNVEAEPAQDPISPAMRDGAGYNVYRASGPGPLEPPPGEPVPPEYRVRSNLPLATYHDALIVQCRRYYYAVTAVDQCGVEGEESEVVAGVSTYSTAPQPPPALKATQIADTAPVKLEWWAVTQDVDGAPLYIENYAIHRATGPLDHANPASLSFSTVHDTLGGQITWQDPDVPAPPGMTYYYYVTAHDDCVNESAPSEIVSPSDCEFSGNTVIVQPVPNQQLIYATVWLQAAVTNGVPPYTYQLEVVQLSNGQVVHQQPSANGLGAWDPHGSSPGFYRIDATAIQTANGCREKASIFVSLGN